MYYTVYKTTNIINNKIYIGLHTTKVPNDNYLGSGHFLKKAIKKYGRNNFKKEVLFIYNTKQEMIDKEKDLITEDFLKSHNTYNMSKGGFGLSTLDDTKRQETIDKIKLSMTPEKRIACAKKRIAAMISVNPNVFQEIAEKSSKTQKDKFANGRINAHSNHNINIYNNNHQLMFTSSGIGFKNMCEQYHLPKRCFERSYRNQGEPLYQSNYPPRNKDFIQYKSWYALEQPM